MAYQHAHDMCRLALIVVVLVRYRRALKGLFSSWRDIVQLMVFSIFGLMLCQLTYLVAIQYSNAGTATVLEYIGPVLIVACDVFFGVQVAHGTRVHCHGMRGDGHVFACDPW